MDVTTGVTLLPELPIPVLFVVSVKSMDEIVLGGLDSEDNDLSLLIR